MKQITSAEFKAAVDRNPAWALTLTEPVEITDFCNMTDSIITHLSPHLHFTGKSEMNHCANFCECKNLKVAEGTFEGFVWFVGAGIERIGALNITTPNDTGDAASFALCKSLKVATGTYPGKVDFSHSGIQRIAGVTITNPNKDGHAADFSNCEKLEVAEGNFPGHVTFQASAIAKISGLTITKPAHNGAAADFGGCENLKIAEGTFSGFVNFRRSGIEKIGKLNTTTNEKGWKADFNECNNLRRLPDEFLEAEYQLDSKRRHEFRQQNRIRAAHKAIPELEI